ncbi:MAG TPA: hypothetical protein VFA68_17915 [Terriglobales bacterium]|nr:hypothetical protein [Terriglobales bacterium]
MRPAVSFSLRAILLFLLVIASLPVHSQDIWLGGPGVWTNGGKWSLGRPPLSSEDCLIDNGNSLVSSLTVNTTGNCNGFTLDVSDSLGIGNSNVPTASLSLFGSNIVNRGKITLNQSSHIGISGSGTQTLSGAGTITLNSANAAINGSGATLMNVDNTISGQGSLGQGTINIVNQKTISASGGTLSVQGATNGITNSGTMQALTGATLQVQGKVVNNLGQITAAGGTVLLNGGSIAGGTLSTSGAGTFLSVGGTLDGSNSIPNNTGLFTVSNGNVLNLLGVISNTGTIALDPSGGCLAVSGSVSLTGNGKVTMNPNNCFLGSAGSHFTNQSTIQGAGNIGGPGPMGITNSGTLIANQASPLTITPDSTGFTASANGVITVMPGSTLNIAGLFTNYSGTTLSSGTYNVMGTFSFQNANIVTNFVTMTLTGASAKVIDSVTGNNAYTNLTNNLNRGVISLQGGQSLTTVTNYSNKGTTIVGTGSTFTVKAYTQAGSSSTIDGTVNAPNGFNNNSGNLFGSGTIVAAVTSKTMLTTGDSSAKPAKFTVTGTYTQTSTGTLNVSIGGTTVGTQYGQLAVSNGAALAGTLTIKLINSFVPSIGDVYTILTGSAVSGTFATVNGLSINSSEHFQVNYNTNSVTLTVVPGP